MSSERLAGAIAASSNLLVDQTIDNLETTALILGTVADFVQIEPSALVDDSVSLNCP